IWFVCGNRCIARSHAETKHQRSGESQAMHQLRYVTSMPKARGVPSISSLQPKKVQSFSLQ
ncbi:MAG: hypothetical protein ACE1ZA_15650, partial [Pseudomonadales bacterium]